MKVALLHDACALDGRPDERDALVQAEAIEGVLREKKHQITRIPLGLDLASCASALQVCAPDLVVNLVESVDGQGRLIHLAPALLDSLAIPYTGVPTEAMFLTSHKVWTKRILAAADIPTPAWVDDRGEVTEGASFPGRYIVKSVWEDASLGLDDHSVVDVATLSELQDEIQERRPALGGVAFAERWVEGREFNLALLEGAEGPEVLPVAEMCFVDYPPGKPTLVGYRAKWEESSFEYNHTVRRFEHPSRDEVLISRMREIALACWREFGLRGYARVDFRVAADGTPYVLEINANPCLSPDAGFLAAGRQGGLGFATVMDRIVDAALLPRYRTPVGRR